MQTIKEEVTPAHLRCAIGTCPAVFILSGGDLLIIGKAPPEHLLREVDGRVADDELAVMLSPEFFGSLNRGTR